MKSRYKCDCFTSELVEIYVNVNIRPLTTLKITLATLWQTFMLDHQVWPVPVSLLSPKVEWRIYVNHTQLWGVAVCKWPSKIEVAILPISTQPVIIGNNVQLSGLGLSQREISRVTGMSQYKKSTLRWYKQQGGADQISWTPCLCPCVEDVMKQLHITQIIQSDAPDWLLTLVAPATCWQTDIRTGTMSTGLICYLPVSPCSASATITGMCKWIVALKKQIELGTRWSER